MPRQNKKRKHQIAQTICYNARHRAIKKARRNAERQNRETQKFNNSSSVSTTNNHLADDETMNTYSFIFCTCHLSTPGSPSPWINLQPIILCFSWWQGNYFLCWAPLCHHMAAYCYHSSTSWFSGPGASRPIGVTAANQMCGHILPHKPPFTNRLAF